MSAPAHLLEQELQQSPSTHTPSSGSSWLSWFAKLTLTFLVLSMAAAAAFTFWPATLTAIANISFTIPFIKLAVDFAFMNSIGLPAASAIMGAVATASLQVVSNVLSGCAKLISSISSKRAASPALSDEGNGDDDERQTEFNPSSRRVFQAIGQTTQPQGTLQSASSDATVNRQQQGPGNTMPFNWQDMASARPNHSTDSLEDDEEKRPSPF
jgi:hypothetical protein